MRRLKVKDGDVNGRMDDEVGSYPDRPGEPDCIYYLKTGSCGYGSNCRFNHPSNSGAGQAYGVKTSNAFPERAGQPDCGVFGDEEWSFGYCPAIKNPMYTYRETVKLGKTSLSISKVNQILREPSREWLGQSYDLLSKNCNHFCERLGVPKLPGILLQIFNIDVCE